jgi:hypothetical protein
MRMSPAYPLRTKHDGAPCRGCAGWNAKSISSGASTARKSPNPTLTASPRGLLPVNARLARGLVNFASWAGIAPHEVGFHSEEEFTGLVPESSRGKDLEAAGAFRPCRYIGQKLLILAGPGKTAKVHCPPTAKMKFFAG